MEWAFGCPLWVFLRKLTVLKRHFPVIGRSTHSHILHIVLDIITVKVLNFPSHAPMWTRCRIDLIHKSQDVPVPYPRMLQSEQKYTHSVLNGAFWDMERVHSGISEIGLLIKMVNLLLQTKIAANAWEVRQREGGRDRQTAGTSFRHLTWGTETNERKLKLISCRTGSCWKWEQLRIAQSRPAWLVRG